MENGTIIPYREMEWFGDRVREFRYVISEHVVRYIVKGKASLREIEEALIGGQVLEEWRNPHRATSYLVCGSGGAPLHVVCAEDANHLLVVLFVYTPALPEWAGPTRRNVLRGIEMADAVDTCFFCRGNLVRITVGNYFYRHDGQMCIVKRLPATLCLQCGEKYLEAEVGRKLNGLIDAKRFSGTEEAKVIEFQPEGGTP